MSYQARIEEVNSSDESDVSVSDPSEGDISEFDTAPLRPVQQRSAPSQPNPTLLDPRSPHLDPESKTAYISQKDSKQYEDYQSVYAVYFDASRSRADGRRVGKEHAVVNPLARTIVDAVQDLGLRVVFEPGKTHPKDWANPGRVRVLVKKDGKPVNPKVKNKHHLYILISEHLKAHPTTDKSPLRLKIPHMPPPDPNKPLPAVAIPRGWKMPTVIPLHSAAMSGGGISENIFKDMMGELQAGQLGQLGQLGLGDNGPSSEAPKKKEKKKGK